jgi:hypothetical protein
VAASFPFNRNPGSGFQLLPRRQKPNNSSETFQLTHFSEEFLPGFDTFSVATVRTREDTQWPT